MLMSLVFMALIGLVYDIVRNGPDSSVLARPNNRLYGLVYRDVGMMKRSLSFHRFGGARYNSYVPTSMYSLKESTKFSANEINLSIANKDRFSRTANLKKESEEHCILTIENLRYNLTAWAKAHPGGEKVLQKFNDRDATKAFHAAGHSKMAYEMLKDFVIREDNEKLLMKQSTYYDIDNQHQQLQLLPPLASVISPQEIEKKHLSSESIATNTTTKSIPNHLTAVPRWRRKLFTKEDRIGIHKYMGLFCLFHFVFRYYQMLFTDPSAGYGTRLGYGPSWIPMLCLIPHGVLSLSSLIFHTVPKERVVGQPMIWQEFRAHNIIFGLRSVITTILSSLSVRYQYQYPFVRSVAVIGSCFMCFLSLILADVATNTLRTNQQESTTATMPYWPGCSISTQKRFKIFYAYCQFMATLACCMVTNPAFPLAVLLAIQIASLLMTLVRKGLLSPKGYHVGYTMSLIAPYLVAIRSIMYAKRYDLPIAFAIASLLFYLRKRGVNKYALWIPLFLVRIGWGDAILKYPAW